ncbi:MAG: hypothetical protein KA191_14480 [Verrucomicrobia bacterium]|nr:hypothetical protein [Verrucomicrobiota bacterium]MDI9379669.1 hypothetical protein [Verrucomicrobiota bacterium]NMD21811.1 hypothetical protein [Verrucomicrobiota bacterium]HNV00273.1 hypothetical protein [Verrucomicrobiota bacterium]HOA62275.1 hypothetical protein [Verrucomicrobiota bacterium]
MSVGDPVVLDLRLGLVAWDDDQSPSMSGLGRRPVELRLPMEARCGFAGVRARARARVMDVPIRLESAVDEGASASGAG